MTDEIPCVDTYRGVGIHDCQPQSRIDSVVKPAIDFVIDLADINQLVAYCGDVTKPPEARLLAAAKCQATHQIAATGRVSRPQIDLEFVAACVAGLNSQHWRAPTYFGSILDCASAPREPHAVAREVPLTDEQRGCAPRANSPSRFC